MRMKRKRTGKNSPCGRRAEKTGRRGQRTGKPTLAAVERREETGLPGREERRASDREDIA